MSAAIAADGAPTLEDLRRLKNQVKATRTQTKSDPVNGGRADDCPNMLARRAFAQAAQAYVSSLLGSHSAEPEVSTPSASPKGRT